MSGSGSSFAGFSTASGKAVQVSEESFRKAKTLLHDFDIDFPQFSTFTGEPVPVSKESVKKTSFAGFTTASGKAVQVSEESVLKAKTLLQDFDNDFPQFSIFTGEAVPDSKESVKTTSFAGFTTASGKAVQVSEESFRKAKTLLHDFDIDFPQFSTFTGEPVPVSTESVKKTSFAGFTTASGKAVQVSEESVLKAKTLLQDFDNDFPQFSTFTGEAVPDSKESVKTTSFAGFITASGKAVQVSEESVLKAKTLLQDFDNDFPQFSTFIGEAVPDSKESVKTTSFAGFTTANGKAVQVSEESVLKAKTLLQDFDNDFPQFSTFTGEAVPDSKESVKTTSFAGFTTASGKTVQVSEESVLKAKTLLQDFDNDFPQFSTFTGEAVPDSKESVKTTSFAGFSTASGKAVQVSEESVLKAKTLLQDFDNDFPQFSTFTGEAVPVSKESVKKTSFGGFSTASGKAVQVSEESVKKAKAVLDFPQCSTFTGEAVPVSKESVKKTSFGGFSTASGKAVHVSEESVKKAKAVLDFPQFSTFTGEAVPVSKESVKTTSFAGFTTASGKTVQVSEESVLKAKTLLQDFDNDFPQFSTFTGEAVPVSKESVKKTSFGGFSTASGKAVQVSEESVKKAKAVLDFPQFSTFTGEAVPVSKESVKKTSFGGFSTASGKAVHVSEESVKKAKAVLDSSDVDLYVEAEVPNIVSVVTSKSTNALETSADQEIPFYENALKKAFSFFDDEDDNSTSSQEELSPIIQWRVPLGDRKVTPIIPSSPNEIAKVQRNLFSDNCNGINRSGPSAISTPVMGQLIRGFPTSRPGKKLFKEMYLSCDMSEDNLSEDDEPVLKRNKFEFDVSDNCAGLVTQEVIDSTIALLADEENCPFVTSKYESDMSLLGTPKSSILTVPPETILSRSNARISQQSRSRGRQLSRIKPCVGSLLSTRSDKTTNRIKLTNLVKSLPKFYAEEEYQLCNVRNSVFSITPQNSVEFRFNGIEFFGEDEVLRNKEGIQLADGVYLILGPDNAVGIDEFTDGFMCSPGVDPRLISPEWIANHYRWIVWTLASYERRFPSVFGGSSLTPENVLLRLKYRYDREIDLSQRSAIHRIIEQDDTASKRMILMVANVNFQIETSRQRKEDCVKQSESALDNSAFNGSNRNARFTPSITLELTDGWYAIPAICDNSIMVLVEKGLISVGMKLFINGAEFIGGEPCHPIESQGKAMIKFGSNSVRRARWDARLGFCDNPAPFPIKISSIVSEGGLVPLVSVIIARVYPVIYMCKDSDGKTSFQTVRSYEKIMRRREIERQSKMEKLYGEVEKEVQESLKNSKGPKRRLASTRLRKDQLENMNASELLNWIETHVDGAHVEATLSDEKLTQLQEARRVQYESIRNKIQTEFDNRVRETIAEVLPIPLLKVRLLDTQVTNGTLYNPRNCAILSIWRPNEELPMVLVEGSSLKIFSVIPPNSFSTENRLNAIRTTKFVPSQLKESSRIMGLGRIPYSFTKILNDKFSPLFGEFDTVGLIVYIAPFVSCTGQTVYFADAEKNILGVKFWAPITNQGMEDVLKLHNFVAMLNLQWRTASTKCRITSAFAQDYSVFTLFPKEASMRGALDNLRDTIKDAKRFAEICEMKTYSILK